MMMNNKLAIDDNEDGLIGDSNGVAISSEEYKNVSAAILARAKSMTFEERRGIEFDTVRFKMIDYLNDDSAALIPLGTFIKEYLKVINVKQKAFAAYISWNPGNLAKLLNGSRRLNYDLAIILGNTFNVDPALWLRVQDKNELNQIRITDYKYKDYSLENLYKVAALL